jgi:hypothetical protein
MGQTFNTIIVMKTAPDLAGFTISSVKILFRRVFILTTKFYILNSNI